MKQALSLTRSGVLLALSLIAGPPVHARTEKTPFKVTPGALVISEEEKAIVADPNSGAQHGVILLEETERDDSISGMAKTSYHLRAKIISSEARDLANVEIPFEARSGYLTEWWGRTILPDGTVLDLKKADLKRQDVAEVRGLKATVLKAALPGVVPGCVVDYGYVFRDESFRRFFDVRLQRPWRIQRFRYRWIPVTALGGRYQLRRRTDLSIDVKMEKQSILIEASDLPPVDEEPYMPHTDVVRANVTFYYPWADHTMVADPNLFWDEVAESEEEDLRAFLKKNQAVRETLASMGLRPEAPLEEKLRSAYEWILANISNLSDRTAEEYETAAERDWKKIQNTAEYVLTTRGRSSRDAR